MITLSVIVPTYNEAENIEPLVSALAYSLRGIDFEVLICDDNSPDLTWVRAQDLGLRDPRVRVLRRLSQRGLGHAVVDGFNSAKGEVLVCIDADLQHDPAILPEMLLALREGHDLVIGSRYVTGGGTDNWSLIRRLESWAATRVAQNLLGMKIHDPMSGYFMLRKKDFLRIQSHLNPEGFKILLEIAAHLKSARVAEVPYTFRQRTRGQSKLSQTVIHAFLRQLWRLSFLERLLPAEFVKFALVGSIGVMVNLGIMTIVLKATAYRNWKASAIATLGATLNNYILNNFWTFRDRAHSGITFVRRYCHYLLASLAGLVITVASFAAIAASIAKIYPSPSKTHVLLLFQLIAIAIGTIFNYLLNRSYTWPKPIPIPKQPTDAGTTEYVRKPA